MRTSLQTFESLLTMPRRDHPTRFQSWPEVQIVGYLGQPRDVGQIFLDSRGGFRNGTSSTGLPPRQYSL